MLQPGQPGGQGLVGASIRSASCPAMPAICRSRAASCSACSASCPDWRPTTRSNSSRDISSGPGTGRSNRTPADQSLNDTPATSATPASAQELPHQPLNGQVIETAECLRAGRPHDPCSRPAPVGDSAATPRRSGQHPRATAAQRCLSMLRNRIHSHVLRHSCAMSLQIREIASDASFDKFSERPAPATSLFDGDHSLGWRTPRHAS